MKVFRAYNYEANLMKHALDLLNGNNVVNQFHRIAEMRIREMQNLRIKKTVYKFFMLNSSH